MTDSAVDTELMQLNISEQLRANSSFMKIIATLFHYGNQAMNAAQLVIAVRQLNLLPLRGETPKSTIQGIISTSRKLARDLKISDPFRIDKDGTGRQAKYAIADEILNGITAPDKMDIPDEPITLRPVEYSSANSYTYANQNGKRQRNSTLSNYSAKIKRSKRKSKLARLKKKENNEGSSDIEIDSDDDFDFTSFGSDEEVDAQQEEIEEDTIADYSLLYSPPTSEMDYIQRINFTEYPIAGHFAIVQQKGYSYPRFRSHEKIKIPKVNCEDKFRVTDIVKDGAVMGRLFILADGHGGPGCSEYFVRKTPAAVEKVCAKYDVKQLGYEKEQKKLEKEIKEMVQILDDDYLAQKREQLLAVKSTTEKHVDNDGCTLILNIFLGEWLVNVNVGDSRTVLISAPEPSSALPTYIENASTLGVDNDYKMDVVFASQDHKPYLEHLARHVLENGGEFVDSVQNRVIKVELDKLKEDGNRHAKRVALKHARIRPKDYQAGLDMPLAPTTPETILTTVKSDNDKYIVKETESPSEQIPAENVTPAASWAAQSAVRTTANANTSNSSSTTAIINNHLVKVRVRDDRIPSLNVARSCGDLDFKMDPQHKIISCEPDVTFIRISDEPHAKCTILSSGPHKKRRRHFLFMSTDGTFDYMYEETAERQNRDIAKVIGPMIEDGEKIGKYLLEEEERVQGETIEHVQANEDEKMDIDTLETQTVKEATKNDKIKLAELEPSKCKTENKDAYVDSGDDRLSADDKTVSKPNDFTELNESKRKDLSMDIDDFLDETREETKEALAHTPLLHRALTEEEAKQRKIKERTLVSSARYFANREGAHGFFSSTLQDYDDCTIILVEI